MSNTNSVNSVFNSSNTFNTCQTGIRKNGECDDDTKYPVPSGGASSFYTTWSFFMMFISFGLLLVYLIMQPIKAFASITSNKWFQLVAILLIAMPAVNSIGVLCTSQLLLSKDFKLVTTSSTDTGPKSITTPFFQETMNINFKYHILPGLLAIIVLLVLTTIRHQPRSWSQSLMLGLAILVLNLFVIGIYMIVPVDGKQGFDKINDVYNNPPAYIFGIQFLLVILVACLVSFKVA